MYTLAFTTENFTRIPVTARYLSHDWGAKLITEVDLIEGELSADSQLGTQIKETLENGGTIDKEIISKLYLKALTSEASDHYGVVVDGIPDLSNDDLVAQIKTKCNVVINMKIPDNDLINARQQSGWDPLTGKSISFLNEQLAYIEDENEDEDEGMEDEAEEVDIVLDKFDPEKLVKTCGYVSIPEDTDPMLTQSLAEFEKDYVKKIEDLISTVKAGYKGKCLYCLSNLA